MTIWRVRLTPNADRDFAQILRYTRETFGERQARSYRGILEDALARLIRGPLVLRSTARDEILPGLRTLHVGPRGRHFILYRAINRDTIDVIRILYDAMDLARHIPDAE